MKTIKTKISGTVQGVTFRNFIKENSDELGLKGFVRNLPDGKVEVVVEGRDEKVNEMINICKQGSPHSEIRNVEFEEIKHQGFKDFKVLQF